MYVVGKIATNKTKANCIPSTPPPPVRDAPGRCPNMPIDTRNMPARAEEVAADAVSSLTEKKEKKVSSLVYLVGNVSLQRTLKNCETLMVA